MQKTRLCAYFCALKLKCLTWVRGVGICCRSLCELTREGFAIVNPLISPRESRVLNKGGWRSGLNGGPLKGDRTLLEIPVSIDVLNELLLLCCK